MNTTKPAQTTAISRSGTAISYLAIANISYNNQRGLKHCDFSPLFIGTPTKKKRVAHK